MCRVLVILLLGLGWSMHAIADHEYVRIEPNKPTVADDVRLVYGGVLPGIPVIVDKVEVVRGANTIILTVSRRAPFDPFFVTTYAGAVPIGKLAPGQYSVEFFVRDTTGAAPPNDYGAPKLAVSTSFDVGAIPLALPTNSLMILVSIIVLVGIAGGIHAGHKKV